ncbi:telomere length regulation protein TEL2 homolog [Sabethes cyaneus]|uniref:telomere length regulation protein TEL2 homolog n=1 Tax=Sabethes cyaneus TaxID=53552 RepID=UPI00237D844E|nr:telomere length regulation protein TEL2 homolog [Sabethes cyaneus]
MDKFISMWKVRELADKVTNVVMNYTEIEGKVREATNDEPWGPTGPLMQELAHATFTYEHFPEVMSMLWKRMLQDNKSNWRRTYKSLLLLNYLVRNGSERVVTSSREHIYDLRSLENYTFVDENGKDQGINVRHKVRELIDFIQDDDKLREERKKAKKNKDKYIGMSSEAMGGGMRYGGGGGGADYGGYRDSWDSRRTEDRGYNEGRDRYEYDYQYDGEREDSDTESNGPSSNRYYDKERSKSPATRQSSALSTQSAAGSTTTTSTGSAMHQSEKKINLNIKTPSAAAATVVKANAAAATKSAKKIDMGAASNYGKQTDLGINSPTHRNTHAEEIIATTDSSGKARSGEILDDLFKTCPGSPEGPASGARSTELDDFNPRADDVAADFGDFESAFGSAKKPTTTTTTAKTGDDFADFASFGTAVPLAAAAPTSELLFSGMPAAGGMNMFAPVQQQQQQQQQPASITNDLLSDLSGLNLGSTNVPIESGNQLLKSCYRSLMELLQTVPQIRSEEQLLSIRASLDELTECLPGPRTPEQLLGIDYCDDKEQWLKFASQEYPDLLTELVTRFDQQFPGQDDALDRRIWRIFSLDHNHAFIVEALQMLTSSEYLSKNRAVFVQILTGLLQDDEYLAICFIELSLKGSNENGARKYDRQIRYDQLVSILTGIPNKLANVLQRETPEMFLPAKFSQLLFQQILKAINALTQICQLHEHQKWDTSFLSKLLSKVITDYNLEKSSPHMQVTLQILSAWARNNSYQQRPLIASVFSQLSRSAIEIVTIIALRMGVALIHVLPASRNGLLDGGDWHYVLCQKIPLFSCYSEDELVDNLMHLLARLSDHNQSVSMLVDLSQELVTVWSSKSAIQKTSFEQHLYLSKLLLLAIAYRHQFKVRPLTGNETQELRRLLFGGLKCHLESPAKNMRCVGMIVSEVILGMFDEKTVKEEDRLRFDFEGMDKQTLDMVNDLRNFNKRCKFLEDEHSQGIIAEQELTDELVERMFENNSVSKHPRLNILSVEQPVTVVQSEILSVELPRCKSPLKERKHGDSDDSELDSDDDLEPFDMTNDSKIEQDKFRPKYLLDLREALISSSDQQSPELFEYAVQTAPELIDQQLANNDPKLALDLLQIFLTLESRCYVENFEELKFSSLVAICTTFPQQCAEYLCREFHADLSKYSLNRRILMLDILAQTAKTLSNLNQTERITVSKPNNDGKTTPTKVDSLQLKFHEENELLRKRQLAEQVIRERIAAKTRRFHAVRPVSNRTSSVNRFAPVAGWFFFPLLRGFGSNRFLFTANLRFQYDADNLLLTTFLQTLSVLMLSAENCPIVAKLARELFDLSAMVRFAEEPKVRLSVLQVLAAVLMATPKQMLQRDFYRDLIELRQWLEECVQSSVVRNERNEDCRELAKHVLVMCYNLFAED